MSQLSPKTSSLLPNGGLSSIVESFLINYFAAHEGDLPTNGLYDRVLQEVERPLIQTTLKAVMGNQKKAAEILGINRNTLRKKLIQLDINLRDL